MQPVRYRAILAYDGTAYAGFQRLSSQGAPEPRPSIQGTVEAALLKISGQMPTVIGAGRTDAGVHATGQVIAFDLTWRHGAQTLLRALNATLPTDIAVQHLEGASPDFHPRYDATRRTYRYLVYQAPVRQPVLDRMAWWVRLPAEGRQNRLDLEVMNRAAVELVGSHDFASFGAPPETDHGSRSTVRQVSHSAWGAGPTPWQLSGLAGALDVATCLYEIEANAFLYRMVRSITGALVEVGQGRMTVDAFIEAFRAKDRSRIGCLAPPQGLTLVNVSYD